MCKTLLIGASQQFGVAFARTRALNIMHFANTYMHTHLHSAAWHGCDREMLRSTFERRTVPKQAPLPECVKILKIFEDSKCCVFWVNTSRYATFF